MLGTLYGIGVGPGDPELITVKGLRLLQQVAVVAYPAGVGDRPGLAESIVAPWLQPNQRRLALRFPYNQDKHDLQDAWQHAAGQVWSDLSSGQDVAFLSEGDISFYSTFSYLALTLQQQQPTARIMAIPGVCSPLAAAAAAAVPLTLRDQRLAILPTLYSSADLETALDWADVVVLMKLASVYPSIWSCLERRDLLNQSYIVERASSPQEHIHRSLVGQDQLQLPYFSLLVVHVRPPRGYADLFSR